MLKQKKNVKRSLTISRSHSRQDSDIPWLSLSSSSASPPYQGWASPSRRGHSDHSHPGGSGFEPPSLNLLNFLDNIQNTVHTSNRQDVDLAGDVDEDPAPPLRVVTTTQIWNCFHALLVHIHVTGWVEICHDKICTDKLSLSS